VPGNSSTNWAVDSFENHQPSAAEAAIGKRRFIAAVNRCAIQNQHAAPPNQRQDGDRTFL
jgi:hypothetical protein